METASPGNRAAADPGTEGVPGDCERFVSAPAAGPGRARFAGRSGGSGLAGRFPGDRLPGCV